jgi:hypothetical protein
MDTSKERLNFDKTSALTHCLSEDVSCLPLEVMVANKAGPNADNLAPDFDAESLPTTTCRRCSQ